MDFTLNSKKLYSNKYFNGETVNYCSVYLFLFLFLIALKQGVKGVFDLNASYSALISFVIVSIISFFVEKKYIFNHNSLSSVPKQLIGFVIRTAVNIGFFELISTVFTRFFTIKYALIWVLTFFVIIVFNYSFDRVVVFDCFSKPENNKNGKWFKIVFNNRFVIVSMVASLFSILFAYLIFKVFPFSDFTVLRMDLYHQYGPLFTELYDRLTHFDSFIYSWQSGGGSSFLGNYFNYLSSPLSLIILLFDRKEMPYAITILVVVKAVLSSASFTYYLKSSFNRHSLPSSAFGVLYAFCGYFLAYYWNIMWIDAMILLPIIVLGIEKIINKGKPALYIASLALMFYASYYMAYMICIFSVLYFLVYFFSHNTGAERLKVKEDKKSINNFLNFKLVSRGMLFMSASVLSALIMAGVLVPIYFILKSSSATSDTFPTEFTTYFQMLDFLGNHLASIETTIRSSGGDVLPNVYSGVLAIILVPLYIINKNISIREKSCHLLLIIFFAFSFNNNIANFVWHAFHFPNDLPYRFSYMYSFIILLMAFRVLMNFKSIRVKDIGVVGLGVIVFIFIEEKLSNNYITPASIYVSAAFVIAWCFVLMIIKKDAYPKIVTGALILAVAICEVIVSDSHSYYFSQNCSDYVENYDSYEDAIDYVYDNDKSFYRSEMCYLDTRMDPCWYGYNGVSTFSSMAYEKLSALQYSLGMFGNRVNSYTYNTQTPVYNMMFGIKYLMYSKDGDDISPSSYYTKLYETNDGATDVYENNYNLPVAYCVNKEITDWGYEEGNPFNVQSDFIKKATGVSNIFLPVNYISTDYDNVTFSTDVTRCGTYFFEKNDDLTYGYINITLEATTNSNMYIYVTSPQIKTMEVTSEKMSTNQLIDEPYILDIGYHEIGDKVTVALDLSDIEEFDSYFEIYAYGIDNDALDIGYDILNKNTLNVTDYSATKIKGNVYATDSCYLYTSIPYDEGWTVYVDSKEVESEKLGDSLLAVKLKKGQHNVEFKYSPKGLKTSFSLSIVTIFLLSLSIFAKKHKKVTNKSKIV